MIYGNSGHPVHIKKIKIRVWKLRDEIESLVESRLEAQGNKPLVKEQIIVDVREALYKDFHSGGRPKLGLVTKIEGAGNPVEVKPEEPKIEPSADQSSAAQPAADGDAKPPLTLVSSQDSVPVQFQGKPHLKAEQIGEGVCFLSDINIKSIFFFASKEFVEGQSIVIELLIPNSFSLMAEVVKSVNYNIKSRIISESRPPYRIYAKFTHSKVGERSKLRNFLKSVAVDPNASKAVKKTEAAKEKTNAQNIDDELGKLEL